MLPSRPVQLKLRIEPELREQLEKAAAERGVSLNKELNERLQRSIDDLPPKNPLARGILRIAEEAMEAAGEYEMFEYTMSRRDAREMNWLNDRIAFDLATEAAIEVIRAFAPSAIRAGEHGYGSWDGRFFAEFFLKQAATGEGTSPEGQQLAKLLHAGVSSIVDRIASTAKIDPRDSARKRAKENERRRSR